MTFFDKKEDVLGIELTPYGKQLPSLGKLRPQYYAFFDDDVLYNINQVAVPNGDRLTEENTETYERIMENTPYSKPLASMMGVETQINRQDTYLSEEKISYPSVNERVHYLLSPLGTNDETATRSPAWDITFIRGEINSASKVSSSATFGYEQIPQIEIDITYKLAIRNENDYQFDTRGRSTSLNLPISKTYSDGTFVDLEDDQALISVLEKNGFNFKDSMEVEVFIVDDLDSNILKPLKFSKTRNTVVNGVLVDDEEAQDIEINENYVEHYFDLRVDKEIPTDDICHGLAELKTKDIYLDIDAECAEREGMDIDIYGTRVTNIEDCD